MTNIFENFILPISGIDFVRYMAIFSILSEYNIKPTKIFCASGGCMASYSAMMSSFSVSVENWNFNSEMFIKKATPITPRLITFFMNSYLYHRQNIDEHVRKNYIPSKLRDVEIVTGYFEQGVKNYTTNEKSETKIILTTNFSRNNSCLNQISPDEYLGKNLEVKFPKEETDFLNKKDFLDYLMGFCSDAIYKTSNIPFLLEPLGKERAIDFGIISPSPRILAGANMKKTIYFCPINIKNNKKENYEILFHQIIMKDILTIEKEFSSKNLNFDSIVLVLQFLQTKSEYCLIIYCDYDFDISLTNFNQYDIKRHLDGCKRKIKFVVFYN